MHSFFRVIVTGLLLCVLTSCYIEGHPFPSVDEVYVVTDPNTDQSILQIVTTQWTDGSYVDSPFVRFKHSDGSTWIVACYSEDPEFWNVYRVRHEEKPEELEFEKTLSIPSSKYNKVRLAEFDKLIVENKHWQP